MTNNNAERIERLKDLYQFWMNECDRYRVDNVILADTNRQLIKELNKYKQLLETIKRGDE